MGRGQRHRHPAGAPRGHLRGVRAPPRRGALSRDRDRAGARAARGRAHGRRRRCRIRAGGGQPVLDRAAGRAVSRPRPHGLSGSESAPPLRVAIVDDSPDDRLLSVRQLRRDLGAVHAIEIAHPDDLDALLATGDYDVLVTDYKVRWTDGLSVLRRSKEAHPDRPVVMFTATGSEEVAVAAMKAGCDDYLVKSPRNFVRLPIAVRAAADRAAAARRAAHLESQLARSEARWESLVRSAPDYILTVDRDRTITFLNRPAASPVDRIVGRRIDEVGGVEPASELVAAVDAAFDGASTAVDVTARAPDGRQLAFHVRVGPVAGPAGVDTAMLVARDVTEQRRMEAELRAAQERERERIAADAAYLATQVAEARSERIVGDSPAMRALLDQVRTVAPTDATVLVLGPTGTGKELIAHELHALSGRADKPLVKVNCAAISAGIAESELFGHEKGAFTGADRRRLGRFEIADGGTIFLDEVAELTPDLQVKLLRVLQEHEFERVGSSTPVRVDVRVVAATNRDLAAMVQAGEFRSDLYYRLNVFPLRVPPLADRREDIPLLVDYLIEKFARRVRKPIDGVTDAALARLMRYRWPGNVRELQNVIERAVIVARGPKIDVADIPPLDADEALPPALRAPAADDAAPRSLDDVLRRHIERVLAEHDWVIEGERGAAVALGINPNTLRSRMKKLGIRRPAGRRG
ncbi:MAG: sigma-54-dependent Fis family transcriptional regulator [Deltaproteobacteria bacterium]|nr:MAG: sigma-54-dependent Fis family transcriptional regulator [Deltaproteobacteria bacterium]